MQQRGSLVDDFKAQYRMGGMTMKLLFWNIGIFLGYNLLRLIFFLFESRSYIDLYIDPNLKTYFDPWQILTHPWTIITYQFFHQDVFHLLFNMVFFYFSGRMFEQLLGSKRLLSTYLLGGVAGWLFHFGAHNIFPALYNSIDGGMLGASASVMAVFMAIAAYAPNMEVYLFGLLRLKMKYLAIFFVLTDLLSIEGRDSVAHFAHLGGAAFGFLMVAWERRGIRIVPRFERFLDRITDFFKGLFSKQPKLKVKYKKQNPRTKTHTRSDYDYNAKKAKDQQRIDAILDKISKSGYDSLSKEEKAFLFSQSRKNQ